jgi:hypothetical protein
MVDFTRFVDVRGVVGGCWTARGVEVDAGGIGETPCDVQRRPPRASRREIVESII